MSLIFRVVSGIAFVYAVCCLCFTTPTRGDVIGACLAAFGFLVASGDLATPAEERARHRHNADTLPSRAVRRR